MNLKKKTNNFSFNNEKKLLIVESPAKAKTIGGYLGSDYIVESSKGHIASLNPELNAIMPKDGIMQFDWVFDYKKLESIKKHLEKVDEVILATDYDREGEAISWHLQNFLKPFNKKVSRITFFEITKNSLLKSLENKREVDQALVNAYLSRVAMDFFIGFFISPIMCKKCTGSFSAGRVQSPALRLLVEEERKILKFVKSHYYSINLNFPSGTAKLTQFNGEKIDTIKDKNEAENILNNIKGPFLVKSIKKKQQKYEPLPPFTTSTLQQTGCKFGLSINDIMKTAQNLYEGININGKHTALITYMRTDSINMSEDAIKNTRDQIKQDYPLFLNDSIRVYTSKIKNAQEAHECIRPVHINLSPDSIREFLNDYQFKVYKLIWNRTMASQMIEQTIEYSTFEIRGENCQFKATASLIINPGFSILTLEDKKEDLKIKLIENESIDGNPQLIEHETIPPHRYNEASLVKELEEAGIGRPSTYAYIMEVLKIRHYANLIKQRFFPTLKGFVVVEFLQEFFSQYIDFTFTAQMENKLDEIANNKIDYNKFLLDFYNKIKIDTESVKNMDNILPNITAKIQKAFNWTCSECESKNFSIFINTESYMCQKCSKIFRLGTEKIENTNAYFVSTEKYKYLMFEEKKIYLPQNFKEELNQDRINLLVSLPKPIGIINGIDVIVGISKFGIYLKYNDKYKTINLKELEGIIKTNPDLSTYFSGSPKNKFEKSITKTVAKNTVDVKIIEEKVIEEKVIEEKTSDIIKTKSSSIKKKRITNTKK